MVRVSPQVLSSVPRVLAGLPELGLVYETAVVADFASANVAVGVTVVA